MSRRLLVGFDGSPGTCAALRHAVGVAAREHGTLTIVTVLGRNLVAGYAWCAPVAPPPDRETDADVCLRKAVRDLPQDVSVTWLVRHGDAARVLADEAESRACDMIVVARRRLAWKIQRLTVVEVVAIRKRRRPPRRTRRRALPAIARTAI